MQRLNLTVYTDVRYKHQMKTHYPTKALAVINAGFIIAIGRISKESPMIVEEVVELSRLQFALTAMYHFLFVP